VADDKQKSNYQVQLTLIIEVCRLLRWMTCGGVVCVCVYIIAKSVVSISTQPEPPWVTVTLAIVAALGVGGSPALALLAWVRRFISTQLTAKSELERSVDPDRSSSNLREDGTLPHD
jgi:hypothetical protein